MLASDDEDYDPDRSTTPSPSSANLKASKSTSPGGNRRLDSQVDGSLKRRFGPIPKKNRISTSSQGTPSSSALTPSSASQPGAIPQARAAPNGASRKLHNSSTDVDLRDASVYQNLFRMTKSNTSKPGNVATRPNISLNAHRSVSCCS